MYAIMSDLEDTGLEVTIEAQAHLQKNGTSLNVTLLFGACASLEAISTAYANKFGISSDSCKLYYQDLELSDQSLEQWQHDGEAHLHLSASFDYSVPLCIWQSFPSKLDISTQDFWQASAVFLAGQDNWTALRLTDERTLSNLVALGPNDTVPFDLILTKGDVTSSAWSGVPSPARPVLLLVQNVLQMSVFQQAGHKPDVCIRKASTLMNNNMAQIRLCQENTAPVSSHTNAHIKCLRAAVLLLKTLQLLLALKVKDQQLQKAFGTLCKALLAASGEASARLSMPSAYLTQDEQQESKLMLVRLVRMALPVMKQLLKSKMLSTTFLHEWNCGVMSNLLAYNRSSLLHPVAAEVVSSGGIPIMMLVLGSSKASAMRAFGFFHTLLSEQMPREQVEAAESVLVSLQAVPRLCNMLAPDIPGWTGDEKEELQKNQWLLAHGQQQLADVCLAAHMINKLLKRDAPPSDPLKALPTPTPAAWKGIQRSVELVLKCGAFYNSIETNLALTPAEVGLRSLQAQLTRMPYSLVAGHLPNLELDVSKIMRACVKRVIWLGDSQNLSDGPYVELLQAFLSRLARDPTVLTLTPEEIQGNQEGVSRHKGTGAVCQGCPSCNGPSWHFKTESVAAIWTICCAVCSEPASHPVAAVAVNALYTALADPEQCKHLLLNTHTVVGGSPRCNTEGGFDVAMRGLKGELTSRLTLGACLARLCSEEIQRAGKGSAAKTPWFTKAVREGTFKMVYTVLQLAVVAPLPWDEERCVALARAIMSINKVYVAAPADVAEPTLRKGEWGYVVIAAEVLAKLCHMTGRAAVQCSLLEAALAILTTAEPWLPLLTHGKVVAHDLATSLVDLLVSPSYQLQDVYAACCEEALPQSLIDDPILVLQPRMLYLVQRCLYGQEAKMYFAKKAAPLVQYWFKSQVQLMTQAGGTMAVHHGKLKGQVPDLQPYTDVLEKYSFWQAEHGVASEGVPDTILLVIYVVVKVLLQWQHHLMLNKEGRLHKESQRFWLAFEADAAQHKSLVDTMLESYEHMRQDPFWMPVITDMKEGSWCDGGAKTAASFEDELAALARSGPKCILSASVIGRLQACFCPLVAGQLTKTEASAMSAYNQLMAEEEEAAAKAAAKKAKKRKQKAKKQQAQQAESSSAHAQDLPAPETQSLPSNSAPELKLESSEGLHERKVPALDDVGAEPQGSHVVTPPQSPDMRPLHVTAALTPHSGDDRQSGGDQLAPSMPAAGVVTPPHPGHAWQGVGDQMVPSGGPRDDENFLQKLLCCPITKVVMVEPVIAADGHTYEKAAIKAWLLDNTTSPVTRDDLAHMRLVPNILIRGLIRDH